MALESCVCVCLSVWRVLGGILGARAEGGACRKFQEEGSVLACMVGVIRFTLPFIFKRPCGKGEVRYSVLNGIVVRVEVCLLTGFLS